MRPRFSDVELAVLYATPHRHDKWDDHKLRVGATIDVANWLMRDMQQYTVADLSCGDGAIAMALSGVSEVILGDFAPGYPITGPIEETLGKIDHVDLLICSETIEHLDDPDSVLRTARHTANRLVLSTPIDEVFEDNNPEHYWGWGVADVQEMLIDSGWREVTRIDLHFSEYVYDFQIWGCK